MNQFENIIYDSRFGELTPEVAEKIRKSREEAKEMQRREFKCPICGFRIEELYGVLSGVIQVKCRKCKLEAPLSLAYFRRVKYKNTKINPYKTYRN